MKKRICFLMAFVMALTLVACGSNDSDQNADHADQMNEQQVENQQKDTGFERGVVENGTYTSKFLGVTATVPEGWVIASDEEVAQIFGMVVDAMTADGANQQLEDGGVVYDLYALEQNTGNSINISVEKLNAVQKLALDESSYADVAIEQLPDALSSVGVTVTNIKKTTVNFAGVDHAGIAIQAEIEGIAMYESMAIIKEGSYVATVTAASYQDDTTLSALDFFQKLS